MGVGPRVLVLRQATGWTFGFLVNKIWSFASDENRTDVDQMFSQPFFCKELKKGDEVSISSEKTFDGKLIQQRYLFIRMLPASPNPEKQAVSLGQDQEYHLAILLNQHLNVRSKKLAPTQTFEP